MKWLSDRDPTCMSTNPDKTEAIRESKSVDALVIMEERGKLLSMTADQHLRFWSLNDHTDKKQPTFKFHCNHPEDD